MQINTLNKELIPGEDAEVNCSGHDRMLFYSGSGSGNRNLVYTFENNTVPYEFNCVLLSESPHIEIRRCLWSPVLYRLTLSIKNVSVHDTGNYSCARYLSRKFNILTGSESTREIRVTGMPSILTALYTSHGYSLFYIDYLRRYSLYLLISV